MSEGPYYIQDGYLIFRRTTGQELRISELDQEIAIAFDDNGVLLKHGAVESVRDFVERMNQAVYMTSLPVEIIVLTMPISSETVDEINTCIAITGYVLHLKDRLAASSAPRQ